MAKVTAINARAQQLMDQTSSTEVARVSEIWQQATFVQRELASKRERLLAPVLESMASGVSANVAIRNLLAKLERGMMSPAFTTLASELGRKGAVPGRSTIQGWLKAYGESGKSGLVDQHTGRVRKDYGWEALAISLYQNPNKVSYEWVARRLREYHGFENATDSRVTRYLKTLPATLGQNSPARIGRHLYNNSQKHYTHRTTENLPVGALYQADGHCVDVYLEHPVSGHGAWRAELTVFMDIRSRYIVGWEISSAESSLATIQAIGRSLLNHNHVPSMLYVDNGCGYKSRIMSDEATGFYERFGIDVIFALPGNAKAKGNVERFFRTMERDFGTSFGDAFCGEGHSADVARQFYNDVKRGIKRAPSLAQWCADFTGWLDRYHRRPHPEEPSTTPLELWQTLERIPVNVTDLELFNARTERVVRRQAIELESRKYFAHVLIEHNGETVVCEYSFNDDSVITVRDQQGRFICDAKLVEKADYIPQSRIEQARQKAQRSAVARLEAKIHEKKLRSGQILENNHQHDALYDMQHELPEPETKPAQIEIDIDLHDFD